MYPRRIGITLLAVSGEYLNLRIRLRVGKIVFAGLFLLILGLVVEKLVRDGASCANYSS